MAKGYLVVCMGDAHAPSSDHLLLLPFFPGKSCGHTPLGGALFRDLPDRLALYSAGGAELADTMVAELLHGRLVRQEIVCILGCKAFQWHFPRKSVRGDLDPLRLPS